MSPLSCHMQVYSEMKKINKSTAVVDLLSVGEVSWRPEIRLQEYAGKL